MKNLILATMMTVTGLSALAGGGFGSIDTKFVPVAKCVSEDKLVKLELSDLIDANTGEFLSGSLSINLKLGGSAELTQLKKSMALPNDITKPSRYSLSGRAIALAVSKTEVINGRLNANVQMSLLPQRATVRSAQQTYSIQLKVRSAEQHLTINKIFTCKK